MIEKKTYRKKSQVKHLLFTARIEFDLVNTKHWPEMKETAMSTKI